MAASWKEALGDQVTPELTSEIDDFERQCELRKDNKLDEKVFEKLKAYEGTAEIVVFFGSWCHGCARVLGRILRLEEELARADSKVTFRYYGLPEGRRAMRRNALAKKHSIEKLPTGRPGQLCMP